MKEFSPFEETLHVKQLVVEGTKYFFIIKIFFWVAIGS